MKMYTQPRDHHATHPASTSKSSTTTPPLLKKRSKLLNMAFKVLHCLALAFISHSIFYQTCLMITVLQPHRPCFSRGICAYWFLRLKCSFFRSAHASNLRPSSNSQKPLYHLSSNWRYCLFPPPPPAPTPLVRKFHWDRGFVQLINPISVPGTQESV